MGIRLYGTSYFDLHQNQQYIQYLNTAFKRYGVNNPISRLSDYAYFDILEKAEKKLLKILAVKMHVFFHQDIWLVVV